MVSSNSAHGTLVFFLPDLRASYLALGHLVLQPAPADGDLDPVSRRQRELVPRHDARPRHQKGARGQGQLPAQVLRELLEGALHARGGDLAVEDGRAFASEAHTAAA